MEIPPIRFEKSLGQTAKIFQAPTQDQEALPTQDLVFIPHDLPVDLKA